MKTALPGEFQKVCRAAFRIELGGDEDGGINDNSKLQLGRVVPFCVHLITGKRLRPR